ncbi:MAG: BPSL0067 family protein [Candidatus Gracilibacteria bacterium]|nr:BPSL0067 family protein [Candidatus Gracilibacteria bacterium]
MAGIYYYYYYLQAFLKHIFFNPYKELVVNIKTLKTIVLLLAVFGFNSAYAYRAVMKTTFNAALNSVLSNPDNILQTTENGMNAWKFWYNDSNSEFSAFGDTYEDFDGYISLAKPTEVSANGYQCVGFVKEVTNLYNTSTGQWRPGNAVTTTNLPSRGDVIATFNGQSYSGHVAIVLSATSSYVYVIDQNWDIGNGRIYIHALKFSGTSVNNAGNYKLVNFGLPSIQIPDLGLVFFYLFKISIIIKLDFIKYTYNIYLYFINKYCKYEPYNNN